MWQLLLSNVPPKIKNSLAPPVQLSAVTLQIMSESGNVNSPFMLTTMYSKVYNVYNVCNGILWLQFVSSSQIHQEDLRWRIIY